MNIKDKMKSQIGDDVQFCFDHEALFKAAIAYIEELEKKVENLQDALHGQNG